MLYTAEHVPNAAYIQNKSGFFNRCVRKADTVAPYLKGSVQ